MQVWEVHRGPCLTEDPVTDPAEDGQCPPEGSGQSQLEDTLVVTPGGEGRQEHRTAGKCTTINVLICKLIHKHRTAIIQQKSMEFELLCKLVSIWAILHQKNQMEELYRSSKVETQQHMPTHFITMIDRVTQKRDHPEARDNREPQNVSAETSVEPLRSLRLIDPDSWVWRLDRQKHPPHTHTQHAHAHICRLAFSSELPWEAVCPEAEGEHRKPAERRRWENKL